MCTGTTSQPSGFCGSCPSQGLNLNKTHNKMHIISVPRYRNNYFSWKSFPPEFSPSALQTVLKNLGKKMPLFLLEWGPEMSKPEGTVTRELAASPALCLPWRERVFCRLSDNGNNSILLWVADIAAFRTQFPAKQTEQLLNKEKHKFTSSKGPCGQTHHIFMLSLTEESTLPHCNPCYTKNHISFPPRISSVDIR